MSDKTDHDGTQTGAAEDNQPSGEITGQLEELDLNGAQISTKPKKKKKRGKTKGQKKQGTGFEEYFVDRPLTVEEHEEEKKLYDVSRPAVQRLETAIQRYQARRNMHSERKDIFMKYLSYGGIDTGPKIFEGNDQRDLEGMDKDEILAATAQTSVPDDRSDWDVDFEAVVKGYLSSVLPNFVGLETEELVNMATGTIRNFLNYILYHDVCPEYGENILAARNICDVAKVELWKAHQALEWSPGHFNTACSTLFGGFYYGSYTGNKEWSGEIGDKGDFVHMGMDDMSARKVVKFGIAGAGSFEQASRFRDLANSNKLEATCVDSNGFEITSVSAPDSDILDFYKQYAPDLQPLGKIKAKPWHNPAYSTVEDSSDENGLESAASTSQEYEFLVDEDMLKHCLVGMKVETTVWKLNCGLHYFDNVLAVYCSFYTVLLNDSMIGWKKPRDLRADDVVCDYGEEKIEDAPLQEEEMEASTS